MKADDNDILGAYFKKTAKLPKPPVYTGRPRLDHLLWHLPVMEHVRDALGEAIKEELDYVADEERAA